MQHNKTNNIYIIDIGFSQQIVFNYFILKFSNILESNFGKKTRMFQNPKMIILERESHNNKSI